MEILKADNLAVKLNGKDVLNNISFTINANEQWAITGSSGSGKTTLLKALAGKIHHTGVVTIFGDERSQNKKIVLAEQQHHFKSLSNTSNFYYQQRFNSSDADDAVTVEEELEKVLARNASSKTDAEELVELFDLKKLLQERLIQLSNGENKRLQIVKALLLQPAILLLDNPFIGLDVKSRVTLEKLIVEITRKGVVVIISTSASHLPNYLTHVLSLSENSSYTISKALRANDIIKEQTATLHPQLLHELASSSANAFTLAIQMKNVHVQYGESKILDGINWQVRAGEKWSLSGPNGSGKSTLLSLVNADNPQAYANDIYLFDRKCGTGETIWDIKKRIGFVSPELHLYFEKGITCEHVIASGLFDTIGLFRKMSDAQSSLVLKWMHLLNIEHMIDKYLFQLSNSEQRLVLLARALVKNPPMLILDEPCQGLDDEQVHSFKNLINEVCLAGNKTLIYVSHYVDEIPECVTKFLRLEGGRVVE